MNVNVSETGDVISETPSSTVTINANNTTATLTINTDNDQADESNSVVTAQVQAGTGYTVGSSSSASVIVNDNDDPAPPPRPQLTQIELPEGFHIRVYAEGIIGARSMSLSPDGTLFVGTRLSGRVYALRDGNGDHKAERVIVLARGLNNPNGVAFKDGDLYVAEINRILRYTNIESQLDNPPQPEIVNDAFPTTRSHGWKFIRFGPDDLLYVPVGAPCNICNRGDPYASSEDWTPMATSAS